MRWYKIFDSLEMAIKKVPKNKALLLKIGASKYCLSRHNDTLHFTEDKCPHNGESLSKGTVNYLGEIICPWHNYRFNLKDGKECQNRTRDLEIEGVDIRPDGVFVSIHDND
jgi:nitrite reductase/ring-hydroxylating ferredoxin subunit